MHIVYDLSLYVCVSLCVLRSLSHPPLSLSLDDDEEDDSNNDNDDDNNNNNDMSVILRYQPVFFVSDIMVVMNLWTRVSDCVRNEHWRHSSWTQSDGGLTSSRTREAQQTLLSTLPFSNPMIVSWDSICQMADSECNIVVHWS